MTTNFWALFHIELRGPRGAYNIEPVEPRCVAISIVMNKWSRFVILATFNTYLLYAKDDNKTTDQAHQLQEAHGYVDVDSVSVISNRTCGCIIFAEEIGDQPRLIGHVQAHDVRY